MKMRLALPNILATSLYIAFGELSLAPKPPETRRDSVTENMHGVTIADPYRWLENLDSPETRFWVVAEAHVAEHSLDKLPPRKALRDRLTQLMT